MVKTFFEPQSHKFLDSCHLSTRQFLQMNNPHLVKSIFFSCLALPKGVKNMGFESLIIRFWSVRGLRPPIKTKLFCYCKLVGLNSTWQAKWPFWYQPDFQWQIRDQNNTYCCFLDLLKSIQDRFEFLKLHFFSFLLSNFWMSKHLVSMNLAHKMYNVVKTHLIFVEQLEMIDQSYKNTWNINFQA